MPTVQDVLTVKGEVLHTIARDSTVLDATRKMNQHKIGALVVMEEGRVVGMFTERDVLQRVVAQEVPPASVKVGDVMTREVVCCQPDDDLDEISAIMKTRRVRHVPVCDAQGALHGIISMGDVNAQYASNAEQQIHFLNEYIYGRA
ncbi:MAG TPA: CBS domain-containing protein [Tepidisphaeraceae bacterium]|nr:CBS domain-containing protein [Tepidisphaeraceae bacterium]